eukprot:GFYU01010009.1.p1 GENE.GFYU01010009.1~~GFYU01010009.1.p1  ORF type:complete len:301 (-),score=46.70 GFYU01010009.1:119-1021(-)
MGNDKKKTGDDATSNASVFQLALASALSGVVSRSLTYPLDTVRARQQVNASNAAYRTTLSTMTAITQKEGVRGLFRGYLFALAWSVPAQTVFFTTYDTTKIVLGKTFPSYKESPIVHLSCGFVAEILSGFIWVPMEVVKQTVQVQATDVSVRGESTKMLSNMGYKGFFRGYVLTVGTFGPNSMIYFACYEKLKATSIRHVGCHPDDLPSSYHFACGAGAGAISSALTTPLDVVKTRLQVQGSTKQDFHYKSAPDAFRQIVAKEGWATLTRGMAARVLYYAPGTAVMMAMYERLKVNLVGG